MKTLVQILNKEIVDWGRQRPFSGLPSLRFLILLLMAFAPAGGCRLYNFGNQGLYRPDIQSVHVSILETDIKRRFLGQRMTEAIVKEIEQNTAFQIATPGTAQSFIRGRIINLQKRVLTETVNDDPRDLYVGLQVEITWTDRAGMPLMDRMVLAINEADHFVPEGGQSMTTAQQSLINRISRQVVEQMEMPW